MIPERFPYRAPELVALLVIAVAVGCGTGGTAGPARDGSGADAGTGDADGGGGAIGVDAGGADGGGGGSDGGAPDGGPGPIHATVTVSPATATLIPFDQQLFTATVSGVADGSVTWTVSGTAAGAAVDASGRFTAPPVAGTYTIVATSHADPSASAVATVTVPRQAGTIQITPLQVMDLSGPVSFPVLYTVPMRIFESWAVKLGASVIGLADPRVVWSIQETHGDVSISADGTFTAAPSLDALGTYHVIATSASDPSVRGRMQIEVELHQDLFDYGGPVMPAAKVALIWWGTLDEFQGAIPLFHRFLDGVNGSTWLGVLDQYMRGDHARVTVAAEIMDPTPHPVGSIPDPGAEICRVLDANGATPDPRTIYVLSVATSTGTFDYHTVFACRGVAFPGIVLALSTTDAHDPSACGGIATIPERILAAFSHELAETITDPRILGRGWNDLFGQEIADDCLSNCISFSTGSFWVNLLVSDAIEGCAP